MKTKICAFFLALIVAVTAVVPFSVSALEWEDVEDATAFLESMLEDFAESQRLKSKFTETAKNILETALVEQGLKNPTFNNGSVESVTIPRYTYMVGKSTLSCVGTSDILLEYSLVYSPDVSQDWNFSKTYHNTSDDLDYPYNCLTVKIRRNTGVQRYVLVPYYGNKYFNIELQYYRDSITVNGFRGSNVKVYEWGNGSFVPTSYSMQLAGTQIIFSTNTVNSVVTDYTSWGYNDIQNSNAHDCYVYNPVSFDGRTRSLAQGPSDLSLLQNKIGVDRVGNGITNSNGVTRDENTYNSFYNGRFKIYTSWIDSNDLNFYSNINRFWTQPSQQIYTYNNVFEGGTVINNNNSNTVLGGALAPVIGLPETDFLDALLELLPSILEALDLPFQDWVSDLLDKLLDFFGNMPDIGLDWETPLDNDYFDLQLPALPDNPSGGGSTIVTVDVNVDVNITRPEVPAVTTENWLEIEFPSTETGTYPTYITSNAQNIWSITDRLLSPSGLILIFVLLGFGGIAVSILFKGV